MYRGTEPAEIRCRLQSDRGARDCLSFPHAHRLTISLGVTSAVTCTYGCGKGRIGPTHCALIAGRLGDRYLITPPIEPLQARLVPHLISHLLRHVACLPRFLPLCSRWRHLCASSPWPVDREIQVGSD